MKLALGAAALLMSCSLSACETIRTTVAVKPPADRMDCQAVGERPIIPPEHVIDWSAVTTVPQARAQHDAYVRSVRSREGVVVGYLVEIEGRLFACSSDDAWMRDFYGRLPD